MQHGGLRFAVRVFDGVRIGHETASALPPTRRQLLAILVAAGPGGLTVDKAADQLWGEDLPPTWNASFRMGLTRLRRDIGEDVIVNQSGLCQLALPTDKVDAWSVLSFAKGAPATAPAVDQLVQVLAKDPYMGVELDGLIQQSVAELEVARISIVDRIAAEFATSFSALSLASLQAFADTRPWDDVLGAAVVGLAKAANPAGRSDRDPAPGRRVGRLSERLVERRAAPLVGRASVVADIVESVVGPEVASCVIHAETGAGRSAVLAEVGAGLADRGYRVLYLAPRSGSIGAFGPFVQELPDLRPVVRRFLSDGEADAIRLARCVNEMVSVLDSYEQPVCLIVDDVEHLDSHSASAIRFLEQSKTSHPIQIVAARPSDTPAGPFDPGWEARSLNFDLVPLTESEVIELVGMHHPDSSAPQRQHLVREVLVRSKGLAGRAVQLIRSVDEEMLLPVATKYQTGWSVAAAIDNADTGMVAAAVGVLSPEVDLADLGKVAQFEFDELIAPIEELLTLEILRETPRPNVLTRTDRCGPAELQAMVPTHVLRRMHRCAADLACAPMERAWHLDAARPTVSDHVAAETFLVAADFQLAQSSYQEAVAAYRRADELAPTMLTTESMTAYATALDRAGGDGAPIRRRAFEAALGHDDQSAALAAATSGLPEAERLDGDAERVGMLEAVRPDRLGERDRMAGTLALSRQLLLVGREQEAREHAQLAARNAATIDDAAAAWLAERHVDMWSPFTPSSRLDFDPIDVGDLGLRARVRQSLATSALIEGNVAAASRNIHLLVADTDELGDPLRSWHAGLLQTLLLDESAEFAAAGEQGERVAALAIAHGIAGAAPALAAQRVGRSRFVGDPRRYFAGLERAGSDVMASAMSQAVWARELGAAGFDDRARRVASDLLARPSPSRFALPIVGSLAPVAHLLSPSEREQIWNLLDLHRGEIVIMGAGVTSLGPAQLLLAHATRDPDQASELRRAAVALCDRQGLVLWQAVARLELAVGINDLDALEEAAGYFEQLGLEPPEYLTRTIAGAVK